MAYVKNNWVDREGTTRYFETVDSDGAKIFTPDYTQVTELGTPVNADNMNHIEEGIAAGSFTKFDLNTTYAKDDLVTVIEDSSPVIYKSLVDNNIGNALSSSIAWEKISLINAGEIEEKLSGKLDKSAVKAYIIETYVNGTSWYRLWSDNWCEQGGIITVSTNVYKGQEVTLLKAYKDTNYHINAKNSIVTNDAGVQSLSVNAVAANANPLTNSTFAVALYAACKSCRWTTSGYIA